MSNDLTIVATITTKDELRYSPAGLPVLKFSIEHFSKQIEVKHQRQVHLNLECIAIGDKALQVDEIEVGSTLGLQGFLMNKGARSRWPVLNVQELNKMKL